MWRLKFCVPKEDSGKRCVYKAVQCEDVSALYFAKKFWTNVLGEKLVTSSSHDKFEKLSKNIQTVKISFAMAL